MDEWHEALHRGLERQDVEEMRAKGLRWHEQQAGRQELEMQPVSWHLEIRYDEA
jgi:hypothetical protein